MSTKYENYGVQNSDQLILLADWGAQTFTPSITHKITSVKLYLKSTGSPTGFSIYAGIRATSGGEPTGDDLCTGTFNAGGVGAGYGWHEFTFASPVVLQASTMYAIVCRFPARDSDRSIYWGYDSAGAYAGGIYWYSDDSGTNWYDDSDYDYDFEDWGLSLIAPKAFHHRQLLEAS